MFLQVYDKFSNHASQALKIEARIRQKNFQEGGGSMENPRLRNSTNKPPSTLSVAN